MAGIDMTHVPYRGDAPGLADTMAGRVGATIAGPALLEQQDATIMVEPELRAHVGAPPLEGRILAKP